MLVLAIVFLVLAVVGLKAETLGSTITFSARTKRQKMLWWIPVALHVLRKSTTFLHLLLFENKASGFSLHRA